MSILHFCRDEFAGVTDLQFFDGIFSLFTNTTQLSQSNSWPPARKVKLSKNVNKTLKTRLEKNFVDIFGWRPKIGKFIYINYDIRRQMTTTNHLVRWLDHFLGSYWQWRRDELTWLGDEFFPSLQILSSWWIISFERPDLPRGLDPCYSTESHQARRRRRLKKRSCENGPANYRHWRYILIWCTLQKRWVRSSSIAIVLHMSILKSS